MPTPRRQALRHEVEALEAEAASYDARQELLPARRDRAQRRVIPSATSRIQIGPLSGCQDETFSIQEIWRVHH